MAGPQTCPFPQLPAPALCRAPGPAFLSWGWGGSKN